MRGRSYTVAELQLVGRVLEDVELGRWPARGQRPVELDEPETVAAVWRVGEVVRRLERSAREKSDVARGPVRVAGEAAA